MNLLIGSRGRLGQALHSLLHNHGIVAPERTAYASWGRADEIDTIGGYLREHRISTIYVAAGIIDPRRPVSEHEMVNCALPRQIVAAARRHRCRVVTFGTVMEQVTGIADVNHYVRSKIHLAESVAAASASGQSALHLRMHTLFGGGPPTPFMFLGQMLNALQKREKFEMSPGHQLREYHHVEDEARAIRKLAESDVTGIVDLSHGETLRLMDIAQYVFERFDCGTLLKVGAMPAPIHDIYDRRLDQSPGLSDCPFRETLPSIYEYLKSWHDTPPR